MASSSISWCCLFLALFLVVFSGASGQLSPTFYASTCPSLESVVRNATNQAVLDEQRMGASLLRLHFHDCFVQGCDGSVLLDNAPGFVGEKTAFGNVNSVRGFEVIDTIKTKVEAACPGGVVSCADILALAARDATVKLGGPTWTVPLGRRDSTTASRDLANADLPPPFFNISGLIAGFVKKGFTAREMTALSGAHTVGFAQCQHYRNRIYNETNIDPVFAQGLKATCASAGGATDAHLAPFDGPTELVFDNSFYENLANRRGLIHSDQELYNPAGKQSQASVVNQYRSSSTTFFNEFAAAMVKMGNIAPLTGTDGQIRLNCRLVNT
uniref:Uncharacterized protein n=1 Tax=Avena sativa TaxID=4498 RepID=A0ACD5Z5L4_AVESA